MNKTDRKIKRPFDARGFVFLAGTSLLALFFGGHATGWVSDRSFPHPKLASSGGKTMGLPNIGPISRASTLKINESFGRLPLYFEANRGQADSPAGYLSWGAGYEIRLKSTEATLVLSHRVAPKSQGYVHSVAQGRDISARENSFSNETVRLKLKNANDGASLEASGLLPGISNYFTGNTRAQWRTNIPHYARVKALGIYPGIDLVYYGHQGQVEHDFLLSPGADPHAIQWEWTGAAGAKVNAQGDLVLSTQGGGRVYLKKPLGYQALEGSQCPVEVRYVLIGGNRVGFKVGNYRKDKPLVIDPMLVYSTYLRVSGFAVGVALDSGGYAYVTGPTTGSTNTFITKINPAGTSIVYSTTLAGNNGVNGEGIAADSSGNAYVTGSTQSTNFPTQNPIQPSLTGNSNAFVTKISPNGASLVYSTYLGGTTGDEGSDIAVDGAGNAYVIGTTTSTDFPVKNPIQGSLAGNRNAFVTKVNAAGTSWVYSTYLGGNNYDTGKGIALDGPGNAYVVGFTSSSNFPIQNPIQASLGGTLNVFVTKVNSAGTSWVYSTYLGGNNDDEAGGIAVDGSGNAYVTGLASSTNFPTQNPIQASNNGGGDDAFVAKINAAGTSLVYSTFLGGTGVDGGAGIGLDASGNAFIAGYTSSTDFPTQNPIQPSNGGGGADAFVTEINAAGTSLVYSTYLGGSGNDQAYGLAVDSAGDAFVAGETSSSNFPTQNPINPTNSGGSNNGFLLEISPLNPTPTATASNSPTLTSTATLSSTQTPTLSPTITFTATVSATPTLTFTPTVSPTLTETGSPTNSPTITNSPTLTPTITSIPTPAPTVCVVGVLSISAGTGGAFNDTNGVETDNAYIYETEYVGNQVQVFQYSNNAPVTSYPVSSPIGIRKGPGNDLYIGGGRTNPVVMVVNPLTGAGVTNIGAGIFNDPRNVVFDVSADLYVSDYGANQVIKFTQSAGNWSAAATIGLGTLQGPEAVGFDAAGNIYVGDCAHHRIEIFNPDGSNPRSWGTGLFNEDIDEIRFDGNQMLWATDRQNNRVLVFDGTGVVRDILGPSVGALSIANVAGLAIGSYGDLILGEAEPTNRLDRLTLCESLLAATPTPTAPSSGLNIPVPGQTFLFPSPATGPTGTVAYYMKQAGNVTIKVWNVTAELVDEVKAAQGAGPQSSALNLGKFAPGVYLYRVRMDYADGSSEQLPLNHFVVKR